MRPDFAGWRERMGLCSADAAALFVASERTWHYWLAGKHIPKRAALLLQIFESYPNVAQELLDKLKGERK